MPTEWLSQAFISTSNLLRVARNVFSLAGSYPKKASGVIYSPSKWLGGAINGFLFVSHEADSAYNRILFGGHAPQGASLLLSMGGPFLSVASIYIMYRGSGEKVVRFFVGFVYRSQIKGYICGA